jgi:hypothetical protein
MGQKPLYEHTDVPPGMTLAEYRRLQRAATQAPLRRRLALRLRRRARRA